VLLAFEDAEPPMEISEYLHHKISTYNTTNENKDDKIKIKIGISYGSVTKLSPHDTDSHPWGYEMVMAKRIADIAKPEHILLDCSAKNNIQQYKKKYYDNLIYVGSYPFKHRQKENIFYIIKKIFLEILSAQLIVLNHFLIYLLNFI
jgi:class 3 adenylate cyclase